MNIFLPVEIVILVKKFLFYPVDRIKTEYYKMISFIIFIVLVLIAVILFSYLVSRQYYYNSMANYPLPRCYNDWKCINAEGQTIEMSKIITFDENSPVMVCRPINEDNLTSFQYVSPIPGVGTVTGNPSREFNTFSQDTTGFPNCASDYTQCPCYSVGDIYWKACPGATTSSYYDQERVFFDGVCGQSDDFTEETINV